MATQRISFFTFKTSEGFDAEKMINMALDDNRSEKYFVFTEQGVACIRGCFYIEQPYNDTRYNIETGETEKITFLKQISLKFEIDLYGQTIMIWGNRTVAISLLTELSFASGNSVIIEEILVNFKNAVRKISKLHNITMAKTKISNVAIEQGIFATCVVDIQALDAPHYFIKKYIDNITQLTIVLFDEYTDEGEIASVKVNLYSSGALVVYKDRDSVSDEIIEILKEVIA